MQSAPVVPRAGPPSPTHAEPDSGLLQVDGDLEDYLEPSAALPSRMRLPTIYSSQHALGRRGSGGPSSRGPTSALLQQRLLFSVDPSSSQSCEGLAEDRHGESHLHSTDGDRMSITAALGQDNEGGGAFNFLDQAGSISLNRRHPS